MADEPGTVADLIRTAAEAAIEFRLGLAGRPVARPIDRDAMVEALGGPLPAEPTPPDRVLDDLVIAADPGLVATAGPRFFGFVVGGSLPAATAADMLAVGWDQLAFNATTSPAASAVEEVAGGWLKHLLGLPTTASVGFGTGAQSANTVGLAAARHRVLEAAGWDVERDGLAGSPPIRVVASVERHATVDRSLRLLGLGAGRVAEVAAGPQGAIDIDDLGRVLEREPDAPTIAVLQSGNVNTGACDDLRAAIGLARTVPNCWVHVDGAFGLWAAACPETRQLVDGIELADSWCTDGHKWLNVPYDCGIVFCADPAAHVGATAYTAAYLTGAGATGSPSDFVLESSRRARGFAVWAALRELGTDGVADLVRRCCALARRFAEGLAAGGVEIANDVVLNQVLASFGTDARNDAVVEAVQREGACWLGGTTWRGRRYLRVSVSNWSTTEDDVDRSVAAVLRAAAGR
jgi:glutamate/tyrosine decarboxylase-like PLP-dependent enzyme